MIINEDWGGWIPLDERLHLLQANGFADHVRVYGSQAAGQPNGDADLDIRFVTNNRAVLRRATKFALLHQGRGFDFGLSYRGVFRTLNCDSEKWEPYPDPGGHWCTLADLEARAAARQATHASQGE